MRTALLGGDNALRRVYNVVLAWERGAWDEVSLAAARLGLRSEEIAARYKRALEFGNSVALVEGGQPARVSRAGAPVRRSSAYAPATRAATIGGSSSTSCTFRVRASAVKGF